MNRFSVAIAGSTERTKLLATALHAHPDFAVTWIVSPNPRPVGRKQIITPNPLHEWAIGNQIEQVLVEKKIDEEVKKNILSKKRPHFLLVVDFGYIIPRWLLELPSIAPVNVHPSLLPKWRGSSPGQFVLLAGETTSAVSVIVMDELLDHGPIISQQSFAVEPTWTQTKYYDHSFGLIAAHLPQILLDFAKNPTIAIAQPDTTPTAVARRLAKTDSFVDWRTIQAAMKPQAGQSDNYITIPLTVEKQPVLETLLKTYKTVHHPTIIEQASRAFAPWPMLWTTIPTSKGSKKMQLIECGVSANNALELRTVKIEGLPSKPWHEVKNQLKN